MVFLLRVERGLLLSILLLQTSNLSQKRLHKIKSWGLCWCFFCHGWKKALVCIYSPARARDKDVHPLASNIKFPSLRLRRTRLHPLGFIHHAVKHDCFNGPYSIRGTFFAWCFIHQTSGPLPMLFLLRVERGLLISILLLQTSNLSQKKLHPSGTVLVVFAIRFLSDAPYIRFRGQLQMHLKNSRASHDSFAQLP